MRDKQLADLNFRELLNYGGQPQVQVEYDPPLACSGYCVHCEDKGDVFCNPGDSFDQISHGCDTSDYEALLGSLPNRRIGSPIMFLLENPGRSWACTIEYGGYGKKIPTNHYYWTPDICEWPENANNLIWRYNYGNYLSYLMNKNGLCNVYITNLIKCNKDDRNYSYDNAISNCSEKWLNKELEIFQPEFVFSFGNNATYGFNSRKKDQQLLQLLHPACWIYGKKGLIQRNDSAINDFLTNHS